MKKIRATGTFACIPIAANRDTRLNENQRRVLFELCVYANEQGECFPSIQTIAVHLNLSRRTVERAIRVLQDAGYLNVFPNQAGKRCNRYLIHYPTCGDSTNGCDNQNVATPAEQYDNQSVATSAGQYDNQSVATPAGQYDNQSVATPAGQYDNSARGCDNFEPLLRQPECRTNRPLEQTNRTEYSNTFLERIKNEVWDWCVQEISLILSENEARRFQQCSIAELTADKVSIAVPNPKNLRHLQENYTRLIDETLHYGLKARLPGTEKREIRFTAA